MYVIISHVNDSTSSIAMSNQSRENTFPFNQQPPSLRDSGIKPHHKRKRLSFLLPPKDVCVIEDGRSSGNNTRPYQSNDISPWDNDYPVRLAINDTSFIC